MSKSIPAKRRYASERRKAQAAETRLHILEAARRLFTEHGYTGTTITAIALEAKVSPETVYAVFGSKRALLAELVGMSVLGNAGSTPLLEQKGPQAVRRSKSQREQVRLFAADMRRIMPRVGPLFQIMHTAAATEPEIATLLGQVLEQRLEGMRAFVRMVSANGPLRLGLDAQSAAETVWALSSAEMHWLLTVDRGWSGDRYESWLSDILEAALLPPHDHARPKSGQRV
ncbi:MAG TPA: TetR family transcriptional regulator [Spirochaetia bacterium]|nr:TetR family transcriptional regulator [Spirochaetia bacterium]